MIDGNQPDTIAVSDDEITAELEATLHARFGVPSDVTVSAIARRPCVYRSSFSLEEVDATLTNGESLALIFKDLRWNSLSALARQVKPDILFDPRRELFVYEQILPLTNIQTATCYAAVIDEARRHYWMIIERLSGVELYQIGEFSNWRAVATYLPQMHAQTTAALTRVRKESSPVLSYDADFFTRWPARAVANVTATMSSVAARPLQLVAAGYDKVVAALCSLPVGMIHGEFYASHIIRLC